MTLRGAVVAGLCTVCACASMAQQDVSALIVEPSAASHADLVATVSAALSVVKLTLADDALTRESTLIVERQPARAADGSRLSGRDFDRPESFQLVRNGRQCVLIQQSTGRRLPLNKVRCKAA